MPRIALVFLLVASLPVVASADPTETPLQSLPYTPGFDLSAIDRSVDPCVDFYQYSCGGWIRNNPIPADQSRWGVFDKLEDANERFLWGILVSLADAKATHTPDQQRLGDDFAACMDEAAAERAGSKPLQPMLARVAQMRSSAELGAVLGELYRDGIGILFDFASEQDPSDPSAVIVTVGTGGLSLPDRDYYIKDDPKTKRLRRRYLAHVQRMMRLLGEPPAAAGKTAAAVLRLETALARSQLTRVEQRDPHKVFHKMSLAALRVLTPRFDWPAFLAALPPLLPTPVDVAEPAFVRQVERSIEDRPLDEWKAYLRWHLAHAFAGSLSHAFVDENFAFFGRTLSGTPLLSARWKRCVGTVQGHQGLALGREFVARVFSPALKERTLKMTRQIESAMERELAQIPWMGKETNARAQEKLHTIANKIGFPDQWRDYSALEIRRDDLLGNHLRAGRFGFERDLAKIGRPLDRAEWEMLPSMVNAGYDSQLNDITFPAGVLMPPLYDPEMDDAPNFGKTGSTIGHELTHAFDDEGRQFDASGKLQDWWTPADAEAFEARAQCIVEQYAQYTVVDGIKIDGKLTEGENIADLGGLRLAWMAWKEATRDRTLEARDGLTPERRFFVGYAQSECESQRPEELRVLAATDPHSPGRYRVNGTVANLPEFQQAFSCKPDQPMVRPKPCRVW